MHKLRKHQRDILDKTRKALEKHDHILVQGATGLGKATIIAHLVKERPGRALLLAPKRKLVRQLTQTLAELDPAVMMGSERRGDPANAKVVIATYQTANARLKRDPEYFGEIRTVVIDEAHISFEIKGKRPGRGVAAIHASLWDKCEWAGFTATPINMQGKRMEGWEHTVTHRYNTGWLIEKGWLARYRYYSKPVMDTKDMRVQNTGDYKLDDIEHAATQHVAIESTVKWWRKFTNGGKKKNMVFAASIEHAEMLKEAFKTPCAIVHSKMSEQEQEDAFDRFADIDDPANTLISVSMLTEGFDDPMVEVAIYARPTASVRLAFQMGGRVIRQWPGGNKEAVIVDLAGVYESTGVLPDMPYDWNKPTRKIDPPMMACLHCGREFEKRPNLVKTKKKWNVYRCPHCGEKNKERRLLRENEEEIKREYFKVETVEEVKKLSDIDLSNLERWSNAQYIDAIDELIKKNTHKYHYSGNRQWAVKIMSLCVRNDKDTFRKIVRGPFSIKRKWQMLMELKDYDITVK